MLDELLQHKEVVDIIQTSTTLYILVTQPIDITLYSDKPIVYVLVHELLASKHLTDILSGTSIQHKQAVLQQAGLYTYDVSHLSASKKQSFSHKLNGTGGRADFLASIHAKRLGKSVVLAPKHTQEQLEMFFKEHAVTYEVQEILLEEDV